MSGRSRSSSKKKAIEAPFDAQILKQARQIASGYQFVITLEEGEYLGRSVEMPYAFGGGKTPQACYEDVMKGTIAAVATMLEQGDQPPAPASESKRTEQVNIRLTAQERFHLEQAARQQGFRGVSDFVRSASLNSLQRPAPRPSRRSPGKVSATRKP